VDSTLVPAEAVELRPLDQAAIEALRVDPAYDYDADLRRLPTPWERFKEWLRELLKEFFGSDTANFFTRNVFYILVAVVLVFAIYILSKGGLRRVFHGAPRSVGEVVSATEDIREMDLNALIAEAENSGDLQRAVRLHYLLVLRKLVDAGVLHWSPDHTDRDYMAQIGDADLRSRFSHLALVFQWVWYGHAELYAARYAHYRARFIAFETSTVA
jgi:hypothetical protein